MNDKPLRIAITGKLRSGKSAIARALEYHYGFHILSFGDALKRVADKLFEGSPHYQFEPIEINCPFSEGGKTTAGYCKPRKLYQDVGSALRALDENVWVRQVEKSMRVWENMKDVKGIVIDDLRQPNEYEWAKANGFIIIRVNASDEVRLARARKAGDVFSEEDLRHETESHVDKFVVDYEIQNDIDNKAELNRKVDEIMGEILKEREWPYYEDDYGN